MTASDPRVGEIQARLAKAVDMGAWSVKHPPRGDSWIAIEKPNGFTNVTAVVAKSIDHDDAEFIAAAPADVAYLLAELADRDEKLARAWEEIARLSAVATRYRDEGRTLRAAVAAAKGDERG